MKRVIGDPLKMTEVEAAAGVFRIINQNMADATKVVSVQRGHDPREFALVSAGRGLLDARLQDRRGGGLHGR